jgi:exodeoxyribonuclease VII large subunit
MNILTITDLCYEIKNTLPTKKFIVIGETSQVKNSHGHLFFIFKDNENSINTTIWKSKVELLNIKLIDGDKITVEGKLDFYSVCGKLNFIVDKIITNEGLGELQQKYDKIKNDFTKRGYFDKDHKIKLKPYIKNVLILTSETGAAYHDFLYGLENGDSKVNIDLIDVIVQGIDCPKNICEQLKKIKKKKLEYDLVVITRGGGSFQDLFGFSQSELIETVFDFNLPILSAIGHQIDNPLLDLVADYCAPTPSLAAQFIVDYNRNYLKKINKSTSETCNKLMSLLFVHLEKYNILQEKINKKWIQLEQYNKDILIKQLNNMMIKLNSCENKLQIYETSNIVLNGNGKLLLTAADLYNYKGSTLEIIWSNIIIKTNIESIIKL